MFNGTGPTLAAMDLRVLFGAPYFCGSNFLRLLQLKHLYPHAESFQTLPCPLCCPMRQVAFVLLAFLAVDHEDTPNRPGLRLVGMTCNTTSFQ